MSKRITLTAEESKWIVAALEAMRDETKLDYVVICIGKHEVNRLIRKVRQEDSVEEMPK